MAYAVPTLEGGCSDSAARECLAGLAASSSRRSDEDEVDVAVDDNNDYDDSTECRSCTRRRNLTSSA